jgi:hypothetical protein
LRSKHKRVEGGDELFDSNCEPAADASHYGRGHNRVLLRGAAGFGGFKSCGVRRALSDELMPDRLATRLFQHAFSTPLTS